MGKNKVDERGFEKEILLWGFRVTPLSAHETQSNLHCSGTFLELDFFSLGDE